MDYVIHILILIQIYIVLATSLNLVAGYTGLLSIAHAGFYGIGAYTFALMALHWNTPFLLNVPCAMCVGAVVGLLVGLPSLRVRHDFFVIATFGFQVLIFSVLMNWSDLTRGALGLPGIPQAQVLGWHAVTAVEYLVLTSVVSVLMLALTWRLAFSPLGRVLKAIREDEHLTAAAGKNPARYKVLIFSIAAGMAAVAGAEYASYVSFIDPTSFTVMESIFILSVVVIGGAGSFWGPVVGSAVLVTLPELLRLVGLTGSAQGNVRQILYGSILITMMVWRPQGLLGRYAFTTRRA